jgi:hypothetical protein
MARLSLLLAICLAALLAACAPAGPGHSPSVVTIPAAGTVSVGTALPVIITSLPPDYTPPPTPVPPALTPIPALPGGLGPTELKYRLLAQFPDLFFCDPDFYPVARANESDLALQHFPELQANTEEFTTIMAHNQMAGLAAFTGEQKLLIYREHKKLAAIQFTLAGNEYQFQLQVSPSKSQGELISGTIDGQAKVTVQQRKSTIATCPICLAEGTLIDTPAGPIVVQNLRLGMLVWTENTAGRRVAQPVTRLGKTVIPATHKVVHLVLADGRELWVSPAHPTAGGRQAGQLQAGDALDGSVVRSAALVSYAGYATYDLLPGGATGFYWANGILMGSTLKIH